MISDYLVAKWLDYLFTRAAFTQPTIYIGLSTTDPLHDGSGVTEPTDAAYARVVTAYATDWNATSSRAVTNKVAMTFPKAVEAWGTIAYFALYDHLTLTTPTHFLWGGTIIPNPVIISADGLASFDIGTLTLTIPSS